MNRVFICGAFNFPRGGAASNYVQYLGMALKECGYQVHIVSTKNKEYREQYDLVVSRAVANLASLGEYCIPFVKLGGEFISYKSGEIEEEVKNAKNAVFLLGGKVKEVYKFDLYEQKRSFVRIEKVKGTPKAYPRKAGTPTKMPL